MSFSHYKHQSSNQAQKNKNKKIVLDNKRHHLSDKTMSCRLCFIVVHHEPVKKPEIYIISRHNNLLFLFRKIERLDFVLNCPNWKSRCRFINKRHHTLFRMGMSFVYYFFCFLEKRQLHVSLRLEVHQICFLFIGKSNIPLNVNENDI